LLLRAIDLPELPECGLPTYSDAIGIATTASPIRAFATALTMGDLENHPHIPARGAKLPAALFQPGHIYFIPARIIPPKSTCESENFIFHILIYVPKKIDIL
jgi:hypothetical protein